MQRGLVQQRRTDQVQLGIPGRHPPLKHHPTRARHGEQVAFPGGLRCAAVIEPCGRWSLMNSSRSVRRLMPLAPFGGPAGWTLGSRRDTLEQAPLWRIGPFRVRTRKSRGLPPFLVLFVALQTVSEGPSVVGPLCGKVADCQFLRGDRVVPTIRLRVRGGQRIGSLRRRMEPVCLSSPLHRLAPIA